MTHVKHAAVLAVFLITTFVAMTNGQSSGPEAPVRQAVQAFYAAFNAPNGFQRAAEFSTDDWNHINPFGGRTNGRRAVLNEVEEVHRTFLKGVTDTVKQMDVRMASPDVAVVTVTSTMSPFTTPDGVRHEADGQIRTFVVVQRGQRWLIMQDHNTFVVAQPGSPPLSRVVKLTDTEVWQHVLQGLPTQMQPGRRVRPSPLSRSCRMPGAMRAADLVVPRDIGSTGLASAGET
jgi:uncharacterized protein (TIGR02246 family)